MFQLYVGLEEGSQYSGKSLPILMKKYIPPKKSKSVIVHTGQYFAVFSFVEFLHLYTSLRVEIRSKIDAVMSLL